MDFVGPKVHRAGSLSTATVQRPNLLEPYASETIPPFLRAGPVPFSRRYPLSPQRIEGVLRAEGKLLQGVLDRIDARVELNLDARILRVPPSHIPLAVMNGFYIFKSDRLHLKYHGFQRSDENGLVAVREN